MSTQSVLILSDIQQLRKSTITITRVKKKMGQCQTRIVIVSQKIYLFVYFFIFALVTVLLTAGNKLILYCP